MKLHLWLAAALVTPLSAQQPPAGFPGRGGPMMQEERKLLEQFDQDRNGQLDKDERAAAREFLKANPGPQRGPRGFGGRRGPQEESDPVTPGARVSPGDVKPVSGNFYAAATLRTLFLDFENADWETELEAFHNSDIEVPATLTVDGRTYRGVGVHFRGAAVLFGK